MNCLNIESTELVIEPTIHRPVANVRAFVPHRASILPAQQGAPVVGGTAPRRSPPNSALSSRRIGRLTTGRPRLGFVRAVERPSTHSGSTSRLNSNQMQ